MNHLSVQLEQLESAELVRRVPDEDISYLFKHALTQEAAYESLLMKKRREIRGQALARISAARLDEAETCFANSLAKFEEGGARLEEARTRVAWGQVMGQRGNLQAMHEQLEKAAEQFQVSGLVNELEEVQCLLEKYQGYMR